MYSHLYLDMRKKRVFINKNDIREPPIKVYIPNLVTLSNQTHVFE